MSINVTVNTVSLPPQLGIHLEDDYPIETYLQIFESHMFLTSEHAMQSQSFIPDVPFAVGLAEEKSVRGRFGSLSERRMALKKFNARLLAHKGHKPNKTDVGCFLGLFHVDAESIEDASLFLDVSLEIRPKAYEDWARRLAGYVVEFSSRTRRVAAVVPHFHQNNRFPHFHFLYEKIDGTGDENHLQRYLYDKINRVSKFKVK